MIKILLLQGANLNYLGKREPDIYGRVSCDELDKNLQAYSKKHQFDLEIFYTNIEGEAINKIYANADMKCDGLVMNPAGFSYGAYALKDCIKGAGLPYVEVHISNIFKRKIDCVLSDTAIGVITGFGIYGYQLALQAMLNFLSQEK